MSSQPSVFRVVASEGGPSELYLGEVSAAEGLGLLDASLTARVACLGATLYGRLGWATENDIPPLGTVGQIVSLLADDIGVCELKVEIAGWGTMTSDDEGECAFTIGARSDLMTLLTRAIAPQEFGKVVNVLLERSGQYVACSPDGGGLRYFATFDDYVKWSRSSRSGAV